jgi:hypothetical protein
MAQVTNKIVNQVITDTGDSDQQIGKLENSISTLDGAINLVGGSVEFLAGALVLSGAASEETAEQFESVALGAIALADGANRALQGYKILKTETQIINNIQKAFNTTLLANPYVAVAVALGTLTAAIGAYLLSQDDEIAGLEELNLNLAENIELTDSAKNSIAGRTSELKFLERVIKDETESEETRNAALKELQELLPELEGLDLDRADAIDKVSIAIGREINAIQRRAQATALEERLVQLYRERQDAVDAAIKSSNGLIKSEEELRIFLLFNQEAANKGGTEFRRLAQSIRDLDTDILETSDELVTFSDDIFNLGTKTGDAADKQEDLNRELEKTIELAPKVAEVVTTAGEAQLKTLEELYPDTSETFDMKLRRLVAQQQKFFESETSQAIEASLNTASSLLRVTSENIDDSTKEGFQKSKQFKIAETRIASIEAAFQAYKSVIGVPIVGQVLAPLAAAAALATGQAAINNIKASTFQSTGNPSFNSSTPSSGGGAAGQSTPSTVNLQQQAGFQNLQAVVIAGDVTSAQAQDAIIRNRRRFG